MKKKPLAQTFTLLFICFICNACLHPPKAWPASVPRPPAPPDTLLVKGLYLENFQTWLPWDITYDSLFEEFKNKGICKCYYAKHGRYGLSLYSVTIFNGIAADSIVLYQQLPASKVFYLNIFFKERNADSIKQYLRQYVSNTGIRSSESGNHNFFKCFINGCDVGVWNRTKFGPLMIIENMKKSVNQ